MEEIERKYLIRENGIDFTTNTLLQMYPSVQTLKKDVIQNGKSIQQGYLPLSSGLELSNKLDMNIDFNPCEARLRNKAGILSFTLKNSGGLSRNELERKVDQNIFDKYWPKTKGKRIEKIRLNRPFEGHIVEFDVYLDRDLIVAEVEVQSIKQAQKLSALGKDVTNNKSYKNKNLAK
jgi:CYTH domain-containing protein